MDGEWSSREPESNGFITCSRPSVSHDGVAREIPSVSAPEMTGHLGIIFTLLSQNKIFLLQEFAAASCYEIHPFEVAK